MDPAIADDLSLPHPVELAMEEYRTLRQESLVTIAAQQTIMTWTVAAMGVVFGAAIAYASFSGPRDSILGWCLAFGVVIPGGTMCATLSWLGEVIRMERVGSYLRRLEVSIDAFYEQSRSGRRSFRPLGWESFLSNEKAGVYNKSAIGYVGSLGLLSGGFTFGMVFFSWAVLQHQFAAHDLFWTVGFVSVAVLGVALYFVIVLRTLTGIRRGSYL